MYLPLHDTQFQPEDALLISVGIALIRGGRVGWGGIGIIWRLEVMVPIVSCSKNELSFLKLNFFNCGFTVTALTVTGGFLTF